MHRDRRGRGRRPASRALPPQLPRQPRARPELLALIDAAIDRGVDVTLDAYPYSRSATSLVSLLPSAAAVDGPAGVLRRLEDPAASEELRRAVEQTGSDGNHGVPADWEAISISSVVAPGNAGAVGMPVAAWARARGVTAWRAVVELLVADDLATGCVLDVGDEHNMRAIMRHSAHTVGSDGILVGAHPHPREWGTFPRFLGAYARDEGLMTLEDAVHHLTGRPARRLGLRDRGIVRAGGFADLVVFDAERVGSPATYEDPRRRPEGIRQVRVNGVRVVEGGRRNAAIAGRAVRGAESLR
ncbi:hypothetical protein GCM10025881_28210 [Pseudolysinimonas kribbensis]|uniref:Amidohydrolase 3 domain-containing protein n=1 Tax=Pseudolysinimonas kribbensis TaxID=433641 RepID=A0ABQ6K5W5_9MICO|nr:amidohydrolase family protein [Pseudolysinimonas kribbensis]GMA95997.1 hypothetical protein GCM10025881_28210 [Pseudolysinimonas kribbensis]